jgi:hypothetical protein
MVHLLMSGLRSKHIEFRRSVVMAIGNLITSHEANTRRFWSAGAVDALLACLPYQDSRLSKNVFLVLGMLYDFLPIQDMRPINTKVKSALVECLESGNTDLIVEVLTAIVSFCGNRRIMNVVRHHDIRCAWVVCLESTDIYVQGVAVAMMHSMVEKVGDNPNVDFFCSEEVIQALAKCLQSSSHTLKIPAFDVLLSFVRTEGEHIQRFCQPVMRQVVIDGLLSENYALRRDACHMFVFLLDNGGQQAQRYFAISSIRDALVTCLQMVEPKDIKHENLLNYPVYILKFLIKGSGAEAQTLFNNANVRTTLIKCLTYSLVNMGAVCKVILALVEGSPESARAFLAGGLESSAREACSNQPGEKKALDAMVSTVTSVGLAGQRVRLTANSTRKRKVNALTKAAAHAKQQWPDGNGRQGKAGGGSVACKP